MKMGNMNKNALAVAVGAGLAAMPVLSAQAYEFAISGHINRSIVQLDNGDQDSIFFADSDMSSSRLRARGSGDFGGGKAGFTWEHQFESNSTATLDLPNTTTGTNPDSIRKAEVWFSGDYGKISLGQGSNASDGVSQYDLGGTGLAGVYSFPVDMMGGVTFVTSSGARSGTTVADAITDFDGGRADRVRYDSPSLGGGPLSFAVSIGNGESFEAALSGNHSLGQNKLVWAVAVRDDGDLGDAVTTAGVVEPDNEDPSLTVGSASLLLGAWDFTVSFGEADLDVVGAREDPEATYFKVGYTTGGGHSFAIGVQETDDFAQNLDEGEVVQFGWGYSPNKSVDLYASWTEAELDRPGANLDDVTAILFGTRVKFK